MLLHFTVPSLQNKHILLEKMHLYHFGLYHNEMGLQIYCAIVNYAYKVVM